MEEGKIYTDQDMSNPDRDYTESHDDEEVVRLAWDAYNYASRGLQSLKEIYPAETPKELKFHQEFYRSLIETSTRFLVETGNWYKKQ